MDIPRNPKYKPIAPSSLLNFNNQSAFSALQALSKDYSVKTGVVLKTYLTDDDGNVTTNNVEYDVLALVEENQSTSAKIYRRCIALETFGSLADFCEHTIREPKKDLEADKESAKEPNKTTDGALVILLCNNGRSDRGIIIGGLKHPNRETTLTKENGTHLEGEFNGVNWQINKDGELTITFKTPTDIKEGKVEYLDEEEAAGTYMKMEKDGSVEVSDAKVGKIRLDKPKKSLDIETEEMINVKTGKEAKIDGGGAKINLSNKKVAIGNDDAELLDQLVILVDALSKAKGNLGYDLTSNPVALQVLKKLKKIKGKL